MVLGGVYGVAETVRIRLGLGGVNGLFWKVGPGAKVGNCRGS